ncbi:MAG: glycosyltransferase family 4 protein [Janthinobacterium lividum]
MKIAVIMPLAEQRGGGEIMLLHLVQEGRNAGIDWLVIFLQNGPMVRRVREMGATAQVIESGRLRECRYGATVIRIAATVRREHVSMVLGWMNQGQLYGAPAALLAGIPNAWYQLGIPLGRSWVDRLATCLPATGILVCSQASADAQARIKPARPLSVVFPGAELARFTPECLPNPAEARRRLGLPESGPLIGIVGRLQHWKGMHVLVEAMPKILQSHLNAHCVIVGGLHALEPDYLDFLDSCIRALGLKVRITLAGLQHNIPEWMQAMDIVVHASDHEPFGIVVIEAMALGKPVIAGSAAGPTEIITDGVNGLLTAYGDTEALAAAVTRYLDEPDFAARLGKAARIRAQEFSTERFAHTLIRETLAFMPASASMIGERQT